MSDQAKSVQFTEQMKGYVTFGETNFEQGYKAGKKSDTYFMFELTIRTDDVDAFIASPAHQAEATGFVRCDRLGGKRPVEKGVFNLFVDTEDLNKKKMLYRLFFHDADGRALTMSGHKDVQSDTGPEVWKDTTTLFVNVLEGHVDAEDEAGSQIVAAGILRILLTDFLHQLTTFRSQAPTAAARIGAVSDFGKLFLGSLWEVYGPSLTPRIDKFEREIPLYTTEGVHDCEVSTHTFSTADKLGLSLLRFHREPAKDVVVIIHGLTTSSDMFIMPEHYNLVEYLLDNRFTDVFTVDFRMSNRYGYNLHRNSYTMDDCALYDFPAAFAKVRQLVGENARIHVICHCLGSVAFMMSLFGKTVDRVSSVIANSVALTPRVPRWSALKLRIAPILCDYILGIEYLNPWWRRERGWSMGQVMAWFVSAVHRECNVPACHMLSFMWGTGFPALYSHENLLDVTHRRGGDLYGGVSLNYYRHVRKMVAADNTAVKYNTGDPRYAALPDNFFEHAAEIETPCLFITGEVNNVFRDSNLVTHARLEKIVPGRHELHVFPRYGHQDPFMGKNVAVDIFPRLLEFLEKHRGESASQVQVPAHFEAAG